MVVGRGLAQDAARLTTRERHDGGRNSRHDTRGVENPILLDAPAIAAGIPPLNGLVERVGDLGIAKDGMVQTTPQRVKNLWRSLKIHIRHPKGNDIGIGRIDVPLPTVGIVAGGQFIEVVAHWRNCRS